MRFSVIIKLMLSLILALPIAVSAESIQKLENIEQAAYVYAMERSQLHYDNPQIVMGKLDPRLRLQSCDTPLHAFINKDKMGLGNQTVGVKCHLPTAWTVYVPVTVKVFQSIVVTTRAITANELLTTADLTIEQRDISTLRQAYLLSYDGLIGQQLRSSIAAGTAMTMKKVKPQKIIRRGELITLVAEAGSMKVKMSGTALSDAVLGQRVRVKNSSSKRVVEGVVEAPGVVKVTM